MGQEPWSLGGGGGGGGEEDSLHVAPSVSSCSGETNVFDTGGGPRCPKGACPGVWAGQRAPGGGQAPGEGPARLRGLVKPTLMPQNGPTDLARARKVAAGRGWALRNRGGEAERGLRSPGPRAARRASWDRRKGQKVGSRAHFLRNPKSCEIQQSPQPQEGQGGVQYLPWPGGGALGRAGPRGSCPWVHGGGKVVKSCKAPSPRQARGVQYLHWPPGGALVRAGPRGSCPGSMVVVKW